MQWWIDKVPTCRSHIDNNNNQATDHNKLVKENADRITCCSNLYITYNRAMDRMEHRGRMVTKSPAATAGLIHIYIYIANRYPLLDPECTFCTANPLFSSPTSSLELVFRTDLFLLLLLLRARSLKKVSRNDMSQKEISPILLHFCLNPCPETKGKRTAKTWWRLELRIKSIRLLLMLLFLGLLLWWFEAEAFQVLAVLINMSHRQRQHNGRSYSDLQRQH